MLVRENLAASPAYRLRTLFTTCVIWSKQSEIHFCIFNEIMALFFPTGNFGGGVQSFFLFLRFLVVLNFVSFLLIAGFVLIPSIVFRSVGTGLVNSTGNGFYILQF